MADEPKIVASLSDASIKQFDKLISALERTDAAFGSMIEAFNKTLVEFERVARASKDTSFNLQKIVMDLTSLAKSFERVTTAMMRVTGGTYTLAGQFNKLLQPTASLKKLGQVLDTFSVNATTNLDNIRQLMQALAQLQNFTLMADLQKNISSKPMEIATLSSIVDTVTNLKKLSTELVALRDEGILERIRVFGDEITSVFSKFIGKGFSDSMRMSINSLSNFMRSYSDFSKLIEDGSRIDEGFGSVTEIIKKTIELLNSGSDEQKSLGPGISTTLNSIADILKSFSRITKVVKESGETFNKTATLGVTSVLNFIKRFMVDFSQTSLEFDGQNVNFTHIKERISEIEPIMRLLIGFTEQYVKLGSKRIDPQSVGSLPTALMQLTSSLMNSLNVFQTFQANLPEFNINASLKTIQSYLTIITK